MATEPAVPFTVRAIAPYTARNNTEVSLEVDKTYYVQQTDGKGLWWQTKSDITGTIGWFPASYTVVMPTQAAQPAPAPAPAVYASQPAGAATQSVYSSQPQSTISTQSTTPSEVPQPSRPLQKEKPDKTRGESPVFLKIQVIEAKGLRGEASKTNPAAYILRQKIMDDRSSVQLFNTQVLKKNISPRWNEIFQLHVWDAEIELVTVRICNGKSLQAKGPKFLGEVQFALRSAARDFDHPKGKLKWFPLTAGKSGEKCTGECLIYVEFFDTREQHGPQNFKHESHVGWTKEGGFDINNIPAEWKKIFKQVGIRRADLENNPELAGQVMDIMQKAEADSSPAPAPYQPSAPQPPMAPQPAYVQPVAPAPAPPPPPPAPVVSSAPRPPAPAPPPAPSPAPAPPPPVSHSAPAPAAEPESGMSDLQKALLAKQGGLRKVTEVAAKPAAPASEPHSLAAALVAVMQNHRKDIEGNDQDEAWNDDGDDWD